MQECFEKIKEFMISRSSIVNWRKFLKGSFLEELNRIVLLKNNFWVKLEHISTFISGVDGRIFFFLP